MNRFIDMTGGQKQTLRDSNNPLPAGVFSVGDIVEILLDDKWIPKQKGSIAIINSVSNDSYSVSFLKGSGKVAWWYAEDFKLIEKNYINRINK